MPLNFLIRDKSVLLRVGPDPSGAGSREVTVVPVENERGLRNRAWIEANRRKVDQLSRGRLAYIYLPDTASGGFAYFNRYFFSQAGKQGAIVDERFNHGGTNLHSQQRLGSGESRRGA